MTERSSTLALRISMAFALAVLGAITILQVRTAVPAGAVTTSVGVFAWGDNSTGELGNGLIGGTSATPAPVALPAGVTPTAIAASGGTGGGDTEASQLAAYAIGSDGNVYAWGDDTNGALGNGSTTDSATPVVVSLPSGVKPMAISAAQGTGYAIGSDGNLYAWGDNDLGKLGDGSTAADSTTPVVVSLPSGVTPIAVAGGYQSAYAIGSDQKLYAWGDNLYGELGDGTNTNSSTPVVVSLPTGVTPTAIAAGGGAGYAIGSDNNLYAWGLNAYGELGNNSTTNSTTPVVVQLPSGVIAKAITAGGGFAHAIGSDNNLYGWGLGNTAGQLGVSSGSSLVPIDIPLGTGVQPKAIADNLHTGYAIGSDGNLYAWGYGGAGELGDGSDNDFSPPVVVSLPPGSTPESLGAEPGAQAGYAIVNAPETAPSVTTQPVSQTVAEGASVSFTATASGFPAATVQWQSSPDGSTWTDISGATSLTYSIADVVPSDNGVEFRAVFTNPVGSVPTNAATLMIAPPPTTSVALPSNGATVSGDIFLDAAASSPVGISSVSYQVSGGSLPSPLVVSGSTPTGVGWLGDWDTTDVPNNTYTLQSVATDTLGQKTLSAGITVTVDNRPLETEVLVPSAGAALNGTAAVLDASASGTSDVTSVQFEVTGGTLSDEVIATATLTAYGWLAQWNTTSVEDGSYMLQSVATEVGGTMATSPSVPITVNNPPTTMLLPSNGATVSGSSQVLDASGSTGVTSISFELSGNGLTDQMISGSTPTFYGWIGSWNTTSVSDGTYTLQSVASGSGGVIGTSAPISVTVDN